MFLALSPSLRQPEITNLGHKPSTAFVGYKKHIVRFQITVHVIAIMNMTKPFTIKPRVQPNFTIRQPDTDGLLDGIG